MKSAGTNDVMEVSYSAKSVRTVGVNGCAAARRRRILIIERPKSDMLSPEVALGCS